MSAHAVGDHQPIAGFLGAGLAEKRQVGLNRLKEASKAKQEKMVLVILPHLSRMRHSREIDLNQR